MIRAFLKKVGLLTEDEIAVEPQNLKPIIISRAEHGISRSQISENALKVLYRLHKHGFSAYLVGGGVRDLLLGLHPKDFDVVTNATPEQVRQIFRNCRLIGKRFRLAHVYFGHDIVEVATFRKKSNELSEGLSHSEQGMILRDNVYGSISEDVWRRDFTINALYYNIADFSVVDYVGGYADLRAKKLRMIGETTDRYREDPVRMLRAVRFACKVSFDLPAELSKPIIEMKNLLTHVSSGRLFEEMMKMFHSGIASKAYALLRQLNLFEELFPATHLCLQDEKYPTHKLLEVVFQSTDNRIQAERTVTPAFIFAALLWYPVCKEADWLIEQHGMPVFPAKLQAMETVLRRQAARTSIPKRITQGVRDIWLLQLRFVKRTGKRVQQIMSEYRFRAGFDFLEMRAYVGEGVQELAQWWKEYSEGDTAKRKLLMKSLQSQPKKKNKKRKRSSQKKDKDKGTDAGTPHDI